jgi:Holliday junction resolvase
VSGKYKGKRGERDLFSYLSKFGWKGRRLPASIIDGFATKDNRIVLFEVKTTKNNNVKIPKEQVKRLHEWLEYFSYYPIKEAVGAVRFTKTRKWVFIKMDEIRDYVINDNMQSTWLPYSNKTIDLFM